MKLPTPDPIALAHSEKLSGSLRQEIHQAGGHISFARYMELALYAPGLGYYSAGTQKLGPKGDFITAPEISPLFAQCIAKQCSDVLATLNSPDILEIGAGSGVFARDFLLKLEELQQLPQHYYILEISADLRERQQQLLQSTCPHLFHYFKWLDALPASFSGIIIANEVMDAMPIHCFKITEKGLQERCVAWANDQLTWHLADPSPALTAALESVQQDCLLPVGYESEINLSLPGWIQALADSLKEGVILLMDYGYGRNEYYRPDRMQGTLMCFYQHHQHDNPFIYPGLQDITAHVDFTAVIESAAAADLVLGGYTTQAAFLLGCGLLDLAQMSQLPTVEQYQQNQAIKKLTLPSEMGELVKVMALTRGLDMPLMGFKLYERRQDL